MTDRSDLEAEAATLAARWAQEDALRVAIIKLLHRSFRAGFEHAIAGGEDAASQLPSIGRYLPVVLYFENEEGRSELVRAISEVSAEKGMSAIKVDRKGTTVQIDRSRR